jgi:hypothetical protein
MISQERKRIQQLSAALAVLLTGMFFSPPVASSQMPTSLSILGDRQGSGRGAEAVVRIQIGSGADAAAFGIAYKLPTWPTPGLVQGSPISIIGANFTGAGSYRAAASPPVREPLSRRRDICIRQGPSPIATSFWIEVPPNSYAQLELRGRGVYPYWPGTDFALPFSTFEIDQPFAPRTALQTVSVPALGLRGSRISMHSLGHNPVASSGEKRLTPLITGHTNPPLKLERISLRAVRPSPIGAVNLSRWDKSAPNAIPLGSVLTDRAGVFRVPPQPFPYQGRYAIVARSQNQGHIAADWNCGPFF